MESEKWHAHLISSLETEKLSDLFDENYVDVCLDLIQTGLD